MRDGERENMSRFSSKVKSVIEPEIETVDKNRTRTERNIRWYLKSFTPRKEIEKAKTLRKQYLKEVKV